MGHDHALPGRRGPHHHPGCHCHVLDPSNDPAFDPSIREHGIACKAIFDCTVPFNLKKNFIRSQFMEIDEEKWAAELAF